MEDKDNSMSGTAKIMHELGKISGKLETMDKAQANRMQTMREDMLRSHREHSEAIASLRIEVRQMIADAEARTDKRFEELADRVERLEAEDKRMLEKVAGIATAGGGIGSALVVAGMELFKRL